MNMSFVKEFELNDSNNNSTVHKANNAVDFDITIDPTKTNEINKSKAKLKFTAEDLKKLSETKPVPPSSITNLRDDHNEFNVDEQSNNTEEDEMHQEREDEILYVESYNKSVKTKFEQENKEKFDKLKKFREVRSQLDKGKLYKETIFSELNNLTEKAYDRKNLDLKHENQNKQSIFLKKLRKIDNTNDKIIDNCNLDKKHSEITNCSSKLDLNKNKKDLNCNTKIDLNSNCINLNLNLNLIEHYYSSSEN